MLVVGLIWSIANCHSVADVREIDSERSSWSEESLPEPVACTVSVSSSMPLSLSVTCVASTVIPTVADDAYAVPS